MQKSRRAGRRATAVAVAAALVLTSCGGGGSASAGDIETWLIEVGNDFPEAAGCVAEAMQDEYSVSDFEKSYAGEINEQFEAELDVVYARCDAQFGITSEE